MAVKCSDVLEECTSVPIFTVSELVQVRGEVMWWKEMCQLLEVNLSSVSKRSFFSHFPQVDTVERAFFRILNANGTGAILPLPPSILVMGQISTNRITDTFSGGHHSK